MPTRAPVDQPESVSTTLNPSPAPDLSPTPDFSTAEGLRLAEATEQRLTLHGEKLEVSRRRIETAVVRAVRTTRSRDQTIDEELNHERVEVERVAIGRQVDSVPPVRQEGDTTILSVVEEIVVVERRLILKEEVRVRRVRTTEHHRETVTLREQEATVTRTAVEPQASVGTSTSDDVSPNLPFNKDSNR